MSGAIHPLPQYAFMAWCLVKAQGQLYLYLLPYQCKLIRPVELHDPALALQGAFSYST
jgi:hypothetical protein